MIQTPSLSNNTESKYPVFGARLRATRESLGIDHKEAASALRLHETIILMLESGQFKSDIPLLFIRGYVRNYSKFLAIPESEVKAAMEFLQPAANVEEMNYKQTLAVKAAKKSEKAKNQPSIHVGYASLMVASIIILIFSIGMLGYWWFKPWTSAVNPVQTVAINQPTNASTRTNKPPTPAKSATQETRSIDTIRTLDQSLLSWLSTLIAFFFILFLGMRSTTQPAPTKTRNNHLQKNTRPNIVLSTTHSPNYFNHLLKGIKEHQSFAFFAFIIISSLVGVAINWQHKQMKHFPSQPLTTLSTPSVKPVPLRLDAPPAPQPVNFTQALNSQFKINALQLFMNQFTTYQKAADDMAYTLIDPSTPLGGLGTKYKKRSRRAVPAYLNYSANNNS